jgi:hypothetical protein
MSNETRPVQSYPTPEASKAIDEFIRTDKWPKPGTMPVKFQFNAGLRIT